MGQTLYAGLLAGLVAGLVSGIMLQLMWVLTPLSLLLSLPPNPSTGWIPHLIISLIFGIVFAFVAEAFLPGRSGAVAGGLITGLLAWIVGPLTLVPLWIGLPPQYTLASRWLKVLAAYLAYGLVLGEVFHAFRERIPERRRAE
ncbi:MAG TPA: hypothetical protein GX512_06970 [Firmicutes bacterium]|nr:hypothetical protein [Candidatus Fermentithermobacillaceae bacterium]